MRIRPINLVVFTTAILLTGYAARPVIHIARSAYADQQSSDSIPLGYTNDASWLNQTQIAERFVVPNDADSAVAQIAALFARAKENGLSISIAGARHSMGGHTMTPNGIVIDMTPFKHMSMNNDSTILSVGAGARWSEVTPFLDRYKRSISVMQSNNDFTVGGSISVNAHGWQPNHAPIASTVQSMRVLRADGQTVRCSRTENPELFALILGGYGLFGLILDVELVTVPNERYKIDRFETTSTDYLTLFNHEVIGSSDAGMAYGRLSVAPESFLREASLIVFRRTPSDDVTLPALSPIVPQRLARAVFRGSVGSDYGKSLRWTLEKRLGGLPGVRFVSRNQLLNVSAEFFQNSSPNATDILHEYFVPTARLEEFLIRARQIIPAHNADLLNVTIRDVQRDTDSFLPYAREHVFGLVMFFHQARTRTAEDAMRALTQDLIDAALDVGGTFYLPYRLHATMEQAERSYPMLNDFLALKQKYDPDELFKTRFYENYSSTSGR